MTIIKEKVQICTNCVMLSSRPRITFNEEGICNACQWSKSKKQAVDWNARKKELENDEIIVKRYCEPNHLIDKSVVKVNYKIVITDKQTGTEETICETHPMRYFSIDDLSEFAMKKGIKIIHSEEWLSKNIPSEKTWGVTFVGEKL